MVAVGVGAMIFWQTVVNLGMVSGLLARRRDDASAVLLWRVELALDHARPGLAHERVDAEVFTLSESKRASAGVLQMTSTADVDANMAACTAGA